jgi:hypothetical protein
MLGQIKSMDKLDKALVIARTICCIEYLAPLLIATKEFFAIEFLVYTYFFLSILYWFAFEGMQAQLKEIKELRVTKFWATIAVIVAPFSFVFYVVSTVLVAEIFFRDLGEIEWIIVIFLTSGFLGLCMPFVLLTYWLKYRYRKDEF